MGLAALAGAVAYAGAEAVAQALERLRLSGLLLLMLVHVPAVAVMGAAWWLASGADPPARLGRFLWARAVRDAAAETLPFLQFGGVLLGVRALGAGVAVAVRGAASATLDGLMELAAKLPYMGAALLAVLALAPQSRLERPLLLTLLTALSITAGLAVLAGIPFLARGTLGRLMERVVQGASRRLPVMLSLDEGSIGGAVKESFSAIVRERARLWAAFGLHLLCWFGGAAETWLAFHLLGQPMSALQALALDGVVAGLRTFGILVPAAAGVQEASYVAAAAVLGLSPVAAVAAALARRARDVALGAATLGVAAAAGTGLLRRSHRQSGPAGCTCQQTACSCSHQGQPRSRPLAPSACAGAADGQQCGPSGDPRFHAPLPAAQQERR